MPTRRGAIAGLSLGLAPIAARAEARDDPASGASRAQRAAAAAAAESGNPDSANLPVFRPDRYARSSHADDTAAVQLAIDAASGSGGMVWLQKLYNVSGVRIDAPDVQIVGPQAGRLFDGEGLGLKQTPGATKPLLTIGLGATAGGVTNMVLHGNKEAQTAQNHGVFFEPSTRGESVETGWDFDKARIVYCKGDGIHQSPARRGCRFDNTRIFGNDAHGLSLFGSDNNVMGCMIGGNGGRGVNINNWTTTILSCDIWDNDNNIWVVSGARYINIIGNKIDRSRNAAIFILDNPSSPPQGVNIIGNQFHANVLKSKGEPVVYYGGDNGSIIGNVFGDNGDATSTATYCMFLPTNVTEGRHTIIGNSSYGRSAQSGFLSYRGSTSYGEIVQRSAKHYGARQEFAAGFGSPPQAVQPAERWTGLTVLADRVTWDPLGKRSGGPYWVWWSGSAWLALQAQAT